MNKPLFTVVIPTYNRAKYICKAIQSVLKQTYSGWKLLIMDDASTDNTRKQIEPYLIYPNVQYYCMEENSGISKVMNKALTLVDTPYLVQVDSDDWLPKRSLAILARHIKKAKRNYALYYGNVNLWRVNRRMKYRKAFLIRHREFKQKYDFLTYNHWMVAPRCYRVSALHKVGGWDTSDRYGGRIMEDRRIILRLIERYPVKWIDQVLYNRTKHQNQLTDPQSKKKRNLLRRRTFRYYLRRWGNEYRPEYGYKNGYLIIKKLKPVKKRRKRR